MGLADLDALVNPKRRVPAWAEPAVDPLSWALPGVAAVCSVGSGVAAMRGNDPLAGVLGMLGGVIAALGVWCTNLASQLRDDRIAEARNIGWMGVDIANRLQNRMPESF